MGESARVLAQIRMPADTAPQDTDASRAPYGNQIAQAEPEKLDSELNVREIETAARPAYAVIWLHGLGADGSDFVPIVPELALGNAPGVRFIFPDAPSIPVTCNGGWVMPAWYDIISLEPHSRRIDEAGIVTSRTAIRRLIARETGRGIASDHVFLAGFSQGGAVAYTTALTHPEPLAGIIALSTYIPSAALVEREASAANRTIPILAAHGSADDVVSPQLGRAARDFLAGHGHVVEWHEYPMTHAVCLEEIEAIGAWLRDRLA
jgi:phospholipase/carboxylesterase